MYDVFIMYFTFVDIYRQNNKMLNKSLRCIIGLGVSFKSLKKNQVQINIMGFFKAVNMRW